MIDVLVIGIDFLGNFGCPVAARIGDDLPQVKILDGKMIITVNVLPTNRTKIGFAEGGTHGFHFLQITTNRTNGTVYQHDRIITLCSIM